MIHDAVLSVVAFLAGVVGVAWSTERLLAGMVGLAALLHLAPFAIAGIFSGMEAENVAVGLVAANANQPDLALGTAALDNQSILHHDRRVGENQRGAVLTQRA